MVCQAGRGGAGAGGQGVFLAEQSRGRSRIAKGQAELFSHTRAKASGLYPECKR